MIGFEIDITRLASSKRHWRFITSGLVLCIIYVAFTQPALRDTFRDYRLWLGWGLALNLPAALSLLFPEKQPTGSSRKKRKKLRQQQPSKTLTRGCAVLGGIFCILALWVRSVSSLPDDQIVLTVLRFTPVSEDYSKEADNYTDRVYNLLRNQSSGSVRVKRLQASVGLTGDESARRDLAVALGRTRSGAAHFVLWGDLVLDEDTLTIRPRLTVVRQIKRLHVPDVEMPPLSSWDSDHLIFKQWSSNRVATLVPLILGWSALLNGQPDWAIRVLSPIDTDEGHLLLGRAYRQRFAGSDDPLKHPGLGDLRRAIQHYESLSPPRIGQWSAAEVPQPMLAAAFGRAQALHQLATFGESGSEAERADYLRQSVLTLESLADVLARAGNHRDRTPVLLRLSAALGFLAELDSLAADSLLSMSWKTLDEIAESNVSPPTGFDRTEIEGYRASILRTRALRDKGPLGYAYLQEALTRAQRELLSAEARGESATLLWYNIAAASEELSLRTANEATRRRYATTAIEYYGRIAREARNGGSAYEVARDRGRLDSARIRLAPVLSPSRAEMGQRDNSRIK